MPELPYHLPFEHDLVRTYLKEHLDYWRGMSTAGTPGTVTRAEIYREIYKALFGAEEGLYSWPDLISVFEPGKMLPPKVHPPSTLSAPSAEELSGLRLKHEGKPQPRAPEAPAPPPGLVEADRREGTVATTSSPPAPPPPPPMPKPSKALSKWQGIGACMCQDLVLLTAEKEPQREGVPQTYIVACTNCDSSVLGLVFPDAVKRFDSWEEC